MAQVLPAEGLIRFLQTLGELRVAEGLPESRFVVPRIPGKRAGDERLRQRDESRDSRSQVPPGFSKRFRDFVKQRGRKS